MGGKAHVYMESTVGFIDELYTQWRKYQCFAVLIIGVVYLTEHLTHKGMQNDMTVSNIGENIYRSDLQVTFELYGHFGCLQVLYLK